MKSYILVIYVAKLITNVAILLVIRILNYFSSYFY